VPRSKLGIRSCLRTAHIEYTSQTAGIVESSNTGGGASMIGGWASSMTESVTIGVTARGGGGFGKAAGDNTADCGDFGNTIGDA
jgi:hypothetical protein